MKIRWIVVRQKDTDPPEVFPFEDWPHAALFYEQASLQWSGVYLCKVVEPYVE